LVLGDMFVYEPGEHSIITVVIINPSNEVDNMRFWLQSTMICCDFSFDGYLHLIKMTSKLRLACHIKVYFWSKFCPNNGSDENKY